MKELMLEEYPILYAQTYEGRQNTGMGKTTKGLKVRY